MQERLIKQAMAAVICITLVIALAACRTAPEQTTTTTAPYSETTIFSSTFDDNRLPPFWHALAYVTLEDADSQITAHDGTITASVDQTDRGPMLISDPVELQAGDLLSVSRRVKLNYANEYFTAALRLCAIEDTQQALVPGSDRWDDNIGRIIANLDYLYYFYLEDNKATTDGFVLYDVVDGGYSPAEIVDSIYGEWFDETLLYDTATGEVTWTLNGQEYFAQGQKLTEPAVRVVMHNYGWYTGHSMDLDQIEIKILRAG